MDKAQQFFRHNSFFCNDNNNILIQQAFAAAFPNEQPVSYVPSTSVFPMNDTNFASYYPMQTEVDPIASFSTTPPPPSQTTAPLSHQTVPSEVFYCSDCGKQFKRRHSLVSHRAHHCPMSDQKRGLYVCNICGKTLWQKSRLHKHLLLNHGTAVNQKPEPVAPSKTKNRKKTTLYSNGFSKNSRGSAATSAPPPLTLSSKIFICSDCGKQFKRRQNMNWHRVHHCRVSGPKPGRCICRFCGKILWQKDRLERHITICHTASNNSNIPPSGVEENHQPISFRAETDTALDLSPSTGANLPLIPGANLNYNRDDDQAQTSSSIAVGGRSEPLVCGVCSMVLQTYDHLDLHMQEHLQPDLGSQSSQRTFGNCSTRGRLPTAFPDLANRGYNDWLSANGHRKLLSLENKRPRYFCRSCAKSLGHYELLLHHQAWHRRSRSRTQSRLKTRSCTNCQTSYRTLFDYWMHRQTRSCR